LIKVMNLVALLFAPVVVEQADSEVVRIVVVVVAALIVGSAVWVSKARRSELVVETDPPSEPAREVEKVS
jgi:hypothetical protein